MNSCTVFYLCPGANGCKGAGVKREPGSCPNCGAERMAVDEHGTPLPAAPFPCTPTPFDTWLRSMADNCDAGPHLMAAAHGCDEFGFRKVLAKWLWWGPDVIEDTVRKVQSEMRQVASASCT